MTTENDADLVEQITRVIVEHQRIPTYERNGENRCSGCDSLYGESDGANSPRHAQHVAEQIVARVFPPDPQDREAAIRDAHQGNRYLRERDRMLAEGDDMCPNCLTPWKCNGPHIPPGGESDD